MDHKLALGLTIRRHRQRLNLSQQQLAKRASLHRTYIGSIERGERNLTLINLIRLAQGLEIDIVQLCKEMLGLKDRADRRISTAEKGIEYKLGGTGAVPAPRFSPLRVETPVVEKLPSADHG